MLSIIFSKVINMSIIASIVAIFVVIIRLILSKRFPKIFSYALWSLVLIRLLFPISFSSIFSVFNVIDIPKENIQAKYEEKVEQYKESKIKDEGKDIAQDSEINKTNSNVNNKNNKVKKENEKINMSKDSIEECSKKILPNNKIKIFMSSRTNTPMVCNPIMPRIILPTSLVEGEDKSKLKYILTHELVHIKRCDNIIKILWIIALSIHWFNPLMWISFVLCQKDMEISCDEKVIEIYDGDIRSDYANLLINLAVKQNMLINGGVLAFGESNIKSRVKRIMKYKKSKKIAIVVAFCVVLISIGVLLSNAPNIVHKNRKANEKVIVNENIERKIDKEAEANIKLEDVCKVKIYNRIPLNRKNFKGDILMDAVVIKDPELIKPLLEIIKKSSLKAKTKEMENIDFFNEGSASLGRIVLFNNKGEKETIPYFYDDLYNWGYLEYKKHRIYHSGQVFKCAQYIDQFSNISSNVTEAKKFLGKYNYTPCFKINSIEKTLPRELKYETGEGIDTLYWIYVNGLSKAIGLDMKPYLGQKVTCEMYYLKEPFSKDDIYINRSILIKYKGKIIGAYMDNGSFENSKGGSCKSLNNKSYKDITGKKFSDDMTNYENHENKLYKEVSKMSPRKVIKAYYESVNNGDDKMKLASMSYENIMDSMSGNRKDELYSKEIEENYIDYVNILFMRKIEKENDNSMWYDVNFIIKADQSKTAYENGFDSWFVNVVKDGECWKMNKMATGF
ncbi:M56 family metallopeptidase [Clostridium novyi]|uniref:M56 family metallopeptidase n=1 Tax=Clostridium novyi TaxID=1542 RepID=UPI0009B8B1F7|nr:M56 family metallopeptidase [Clostridium novyi]